MSTLRFANSAKSIKNKVIVNEETSGSLELLQTEVRRLKEELSKAQLSTMYINQGDNGNPINALRSRNEGGLKLELLVQEIMDLNKENRSFMETAQKNFSKEMAD